MNVLLCSVPFSPSVGGIESVAALLAEGLPALGHRVVLLTRTPAAQPDRLPYRVVRQPGARALLQWLRWCDVVLHNNLSLRWAWPLPLLRRPWLVAHHTWIPREGTGSVAGRAKHAVLRHAHNVAASSALADGLALPCAVIPNPYADDCFRRIPEVGRSRDLVFVGRLVSDKGVSVLLEALSLLRERGLRPGLTLVGSGPEEPALRRQAERLGLQPQVTFAGRLERDALALVLNAHRLLVVPSTWQEPFGLVVLEAMACGCVPVVARSGGLPEAVGEAGVVVPRGNPAALADAMAGLLADEPALDRLRGRAAGQLARHRRDSVARQYDAAIVEACRAHAARRPA